MPLTTETALRTNVPLLVADFRILLRSDSEVELGGQLALDGNGGEVALRLDELHRRIVQSQLSRFTVDVRRLDFVNSSAIRFFVNWIQKAEQHSYQLAFITDAQVTWQRLSFSVLQSLAPGAVEIRSEPPAAAERPEL